MRLKRELVRLKKQYEAKLAQAEAHRSTGLAPTSHMPSPTPYAHIPTEHAPTPCPLPPHAHIPTPLAPRPRHVPSPLWMVVTWLWGALLCPWTIPAHCVTVLVQAHLRDALERQYIDLAGSHDERMALRDADELAAKEELLFKQATRRWLYTSNPNPKHQH
jgi:hypothetical protein